MIKSSFAKKCLFIILSIFLIICLKDIPYQILVEFNKSITLTDSELEYLLKNKNFYLSSDVVGAYYNEEQEEFMQDFVIQYKLFNLINVKSLRANVVYEKYYAGGDCLGFNLHTQGVIVVGGNYIITKDGKSNPMKDSGLKVGDIIINIGGEEISSIGDIVEVLDKYKGEGGLDFTYIREGEERKGVIVPALDIQTKKYKIGLWLKDDAIGVGTLTFIDGNTGRFGALGHAISSSDNNTPIEISGGNIYQCRVVGVKLGSKGTPGQLLGVFAPNSHPIGSADKNTNNGVFGFMDNVEEVTQGKEVIKLGGRLTARPGKAKILSCINGKDIEEYDIEIIKTNYQSNATEKSMVIRVTDKRLLEKTGGIVQGMSGSPIIQNGKLIGAVTHVFISDASKGFGLYIDWMVNE